MLEVFFLYLLMIRKSVRLDNICCLLNNKQLLSLLSGGSQRQNMHVIPNYLL